MAQSWYQVRSRGWWASAIGFFLALELALRIKLGSIFVLSAAWAFCHQLLAARLGHTADPAPARQVMIALYAGMVVAAAVFVALAVLNIGLRSLDADWRWFQLP